MAHRSSVDLFADVYPDGVAIVVDGHVAYANPALASMLGYVSPTWLVGIALTDLVDPTDRARLRDWQMSGHGPRAGAWPTLRLIQYRGGRCHVELAPIYPVEHHGQIGRLLVARDLGHRQRISDRSQPTDHMPSASKILNGLVLAFKSPLSALLESLDQLDIEVSRLASKSADGQLEPLDTALDQTSRTAERIRALVVQLEGLANPCPGAKTQTDVVATVSDALRRMRSTLSGRATVTTRLQATPEITADSDSLRHAVIHVLQNAAQGVSRRDLRNHEIVVSTYTDPQGRAVVEVKDTGCGISPRQLNQALEPFYTTTPGRAGLGLSICDRVVSDLGGETLIKSSVGHGTCVTIRLPAASTPAPDQAAIEPARPAQRPGRRILVIEDDPMVANTYRRILQERDVTLLDRGREALEVCRREQFDVVFCDLALPDLTGMDIYEELVRRQTGQDARMVFVTGGACTERARAFLTAVSNPCLLKPFTPDSLCQFADEWSPDGT